MFDTQLVLLDEDYRRIAAGCDRQGRDAHTKCTYVVDKSGQTPFQTGELLNRESTSLPSFTRRCTVATASPCQILR